MDHTDDPYILVIQTPDSPRDTWIAFYSPTPFMTIQTGDILNPSTWEPPIEGGKVLRVLGVEHVIWESSGRVKHKIVIYTTAVDQTDTNSEGIYF